MGTYRKLQLGKLSRWAALLTTVALGPPAGVAASDATPSTMADIYAALRIQNLVPYAGPFFVSGDQVYFTYNLTNTSPNALVVPLNTDFSSPFHLVGVEQTWVERLGPDPTIPSLAYAFRDGRKYATGGQILVEDGAFPNDTIPAGGSLSRYTALYTTGFPQGQYRYYIDYKRLDGGVIETATVQISNTGFLDIDTTPPTVSVPSMISTAATSPSGAPVTFSVSASDPDDTASAPSCWPPSGSIFPVGVTTVNCISTDTNDNIGSASFLVDVTALGADCDLADYPLAKGALNLKGATLGGCYLPNANLTGAVASNANLKGADLAGANLSGADLSQANLTNAILNNANLANANLAGATLAGANTSGASFTAVKWSQTVCPDGTISNANGGTCIGHL